MSAAVRGFGTVAAAVGLLIASMPFWALVTMPTDWRPTIAFGLLLALLGAWLMTFDMPGTARPIRRGLLLLVAGATCFFLLGPSAWGSGSVAAIGLMALGILFATIGLYQLVLGLIANQVHPADGGRATEGDRAR